MKNIFISLILLFAGSTGYSQTLWTQSEQPTGGTCYAIQRVGNQIWAAYVFGVYVSSNEGITWSRHPFLLDATIDIKAIGDTIILLIEEHPSATVYNLSTKTSYDGGLTWNNPVVAETGNTYYTWGDREIFVLDDALVLRSNGSEFYVSYNFGQTWSNLIFPGNWDLSDHSRSHLLCFNPVYPQFGNFYSNDGGVSWNFLDSNYISSSALVIDSTFYFSASYVDTVNHTFIARTSDFGVTYDTLALDLLGYGQLSYFDGKIYHKNYQTSTPIIRESADGGDTWSLSTLPSEMAFASHHNSIILGHWDWLVEQGTLGIHTYNPGSSTAYRTETGIRAKVITFLKENNKALFAKSEGVMYRSANANSTWASVPSYVNGASDFEFLGDTIYCFTKSANSTNNLCYSFDNGATWDSLLTSAMPNWIHANTIKHLNGKLYASSNNGVIFSNNWGASWNPISNTVDSTCIGATNLNPDQLIVCNNTLFALEGSRVSAFDTLTQTWKRKLCFSTPGVNYDNLFSLEGYLVITSGSTFKVSSDTGNTWTIPARIGFPSNVRPTSLSSINGIWFSPALGNLYYSNNAGENWQQLQTSVGMSVTGYEEPVITMLNGILYAGGNNVWRNSDTLRVITGKVYLDNNFNGIKEVNEPVVPGHLLYASPGNIAFNTDSTGNYQFLTVAAGEVIQPSLPSPLCVSTPAGYVTTGSAANVDFGLYVPPGIQDLTVDITNRTVFRSGFQTYVDVDVRNLGSVELAGQLQVVLDSSLIFISATVLPVSVNGDTLLFDTDTLSFLDSQHFAIDVETVIPSPIGTPIECVATIFPIIGDTVVPNNYSHFVEPVVGSYDPNDKSSSYHPYFTPTQLLNNEEMVYTIRFQNTGNFAADHVHITDTLSDFMDLSTFRLISTSHTSYYNFTPGRVVTFNFDNINLPPTILDEPNSHGYVKYGIRFFGGLPIGTGIDNNAYIYFDFNPPIQTNTVSTLVAYPPVNVSIPEVEGIINVLVFPNPVSDVLNGIIEGLGIDDEIKLTLTNLSGQAVHSQRLNGSAFSVDVSSFNNGIYLGRLENSSTSRVVVFRIAVLH